MEPPLCGGGSQRLSVTTSPGSDVSVRLQQQLAAAIRGALEVAVEIAVREVTELVGQTTGDIWEHVRRENESLRQRLRRAEQELLQLDRCGSPAESRLLPGNQAGEPPPHTPGAAGADSGTGVAAAGEDEPAPGREDKDVSSKERCDAASSQPEERHNAADDTSEHIPHACEVKVENISQPCPDEAAPRCPPSPPPTAESSTTEQVMVKLEEEDDEDQRDGSACCLDSIKLEDFSPECTPDVQSINLYEWNPEVNDVCPRDPNTQLTRGHRSNPTTGLPPPTDLPSLSSEFADILQLAEAARPPDASPQVCGVHVHTSCNIANLYACKTCSQTFHLPSLLRRHAPLCQRQLQQFCSPAAGSKRTRLQLYPPGCSPFRCTECNREFNRMENLKTHLRIHTGERPYTCSVCAKCFRHSGALTRHFRIHTGEKPYVCGQCGKSFRNCGGLKFHQRSHSK